MDRSLRRSGGRRSFIGMPAGVVIGYAWRDRISRARRLRYIAKHARKDAELHRAVAAEGNVIASGTGTVKPKQRRKKPAKSTAVK
jgi:hypothetical protein